MQQLSIIHIHLSSGEDILAHFLEMSQESLSILDPLYVHVDPHNGVFIKDWLLFSSKRTCPIPLKDVMFVSDASDEAIMYYNSYMDRKNPDETDDIDPVSKDLMDSKMAIKH